MQRIVIRPQQVANGPEIIRRLGVIAMNAAVEVQACVEAQLAHLFILSCLDPGRHLWPRQLNSCQRLAHAQRYLLGSPESKTHFLIFFLYVRHWRLW